MVILLALIAAISLPPKPDHYVTDRAGALKNTDALNAKLADFERETSDQLLVYVDQHLPPNTTIEEMGSEAIKQWGVGQKGKDNGAVLFVFVADRKMRVEVGYGLEGSLTDAKSRDIIETVIKPQFKSGDYSAGVEKGVAAMMATIRGEPYQGTGRTVAEGPKPRRMNSDVEGLLWIVGAVILSFVTFSPFFMIFWLLSRAYKKNPERFVQTFSSSGVSSGGSSSWSSGSSSFSSSSSSSSSSGFSGGGGSGGGGGASGSW